ncbi:MAG: universal stress protein [Sedimentisphaerales bacterium]|nr:universal stress protein [Sedimentisphaerales bacterium]
MSINLKKIVYPTDFSEFSMCAVPYALELAEEFGAELHCLHVVDEVGQYWVGASESAVPLVISPEELLKSAEEQLAKFVAEHFETTKVKVVSKLVSGRPFVEIIRYAREEEIDMIVIATHGRGGLASMLLGSVAEKVVRKAPCPVLTVRHPEHEFVMP